ncbi:heterokaryon incompatibility protein-domain-containing protein [Camillea tinctor]|nr:heterokaryon incompatibility protein-domain-containing protein [Camillea tinctor]
MSNVLEGTLCPRCRKIPLRSLLYGPQDSKEQACIGKLLQILTEDLCHFCRFTKYTLVTFYGKKPVEEIVRINPNTKVFAYRDTLDITPYFEDQLTRELPPPSCICFHFSKPSDRAEGTVLTERNERMKNARVHAPTRVIPLRHGEEAEEPMNFGRIVAPDRIDWAVVKDWLSSCFKKHRYDITEGKEPDFQNSPGNLKIRAIDVDKACVVILPEGAQYIALSYVWGKDQALKLKMENLSLFSSPGYFASADCRPSRTIVDAMHASRSLGFRYLWIDALCIIQDDPVNIQANVDNMRKIYADALLTIVAASGSDADSGLPGVSGDHPRLTIQKRCTVDGITMANELEIDTNDSKWNTRGWTYQERVLSPRLLLFNLSQVIYHCDMGCDEEEQYHTRQNGAQFRVRDQAHHLDLDDLDIFAAYVGALTEYTKRAITDPTDKIKAFDGILQLLQRPFKGPFFFGLPASMFDVGLLWVPIGRCVRRKGDFPSWSWAGWDGVVQYDYLEGFSSPTNICECTVSQCSIKTADTGVRLCSPHTPKSDALTSNAYDNTKWSRHFDEDSLQIYYRTTEENLGQFKYPRPLAVLNQEERRLLSKGGPVVLQIEGKVAQFHLTGQHSGVYNGDSPCHKGRHYDCHLAVLDEKGQVVGRVVVDSYTVPELQNRNHKFLGLSRSTLYRIDDDPSWNEKTNSFTPWTAQVTGEEEEETIYEEYRKRFKDWVAKAPPGPDDGSPLLSEPAENLDMPSLFMNDFDGPEQNTGPFDSRIFNSKVLWPLVNVILLSEETNGTVERVGIGQIHVDAFAPKARNETVLLR